MASFWEQKWHTTTHHVCWTKRQFDARNVSAKHRHTEMLPMPLHRACPCARPWQRVIQKPSTKKCKNLNQLGFKLASAASSEMIVQNWSDAVNIRSHHSWHYLTDSTIIPSPFTIFGPRRRQKCQGWPPHAWYQNASNPLHFWNLHSSHPWPELPGKLPCLWQAWMGRQNALQAGGFNPSQTIFKLHLPKKQMAPQVILIVLCSYISSHFKFVG